MNLNQKDLCWACAMNRCDQVQKKDNTCSCCRANHKR